MRHEITLTTFAVHTDSGVVEVGFDWNGTPHSVSFGSIAQFNADNADMIQTENEAARFLLCYMLLLGETVDTLPNKVGKMLTLEVGPAVQQLVSIA